MAQHEENQLFGECPFALINPLQLPDALWGSLSTYPLQPIGLNDPARLLPRLICLSELNATQRLELWGTIQDWQRIQSKPFFCAYLFSPASRESLIYHLSQQLLPYGVDGRDSLLRFYSPDVFQQLMWILSPQQLAALMGPVEAWYWLDRDGQWQCQERPPATTSSVFLQREQLDRLGRSGVLNRTINHLRREPDVLPEVNAALFSKIDALLDRALNSEGLVDDADCILFVQQALTIHPNIHRHPTLQAFLEMARSGQCSYVSACQQLSTSELKGWDAYDFKERT